MLLFYSSRNGQIVERPDSFSGTQLFANLTSAALPAFQDAEAVLVALGRLDNCNIDLVLPAVDAAATLLARAAAPPDGTSRAAAKLDMPPPAALAAALYGLANLGVRHPAFLSAAAQPLARAVPCLLYTSPSPRD